MIAAYRRQDWEEAAAALAVAKSLDVTLVKLYALYQERIAEYRAQTLPTDWDGVYVARTKSG
jgi:hypothetical protein